MRNVIHTITILAALTGLGTVVGCSQETTSGLPPPTAQQDPSFGQEGLHTESRGLPQTKTDGKPSSEPGRTPPPDGMVIPSPNR